MKPGDCVYKYRGLPARAATATEVETVNMTHRCIKVVIFGALFSVFLHVSCATAAKNCARIIPGVDRMRSGWDITVLDVKPMDRTKDHGDRQPILDFTCNKGEKWINPKDPEKV